MIRFNTILEHQDSLAILHKQFLTFAGIGGTVYVYNNEKLVSSTKIWPGQKIHLIKSDTNDVIYVVGGKYIALCSYDSTDLNVIHTFRSIDWIFDIVQQSPSKILLLSSHNQVYTYDFSKSQLSLAKSTSEKSILYCGIFHYVGKELYVLAGTVFSETLVWHLGDTNPDTPSIISKRIEGHKGVIFSISARNLASQKSIICTTSDDRTANINFSNDLSLKENLEFRSLHGHTSRVWKSLMTEENIFTIGEDSLICSWTYDGRLIKKCEFSTCGGIRSISLDTSLNNFLIGGCDGSIQNIPRDLLLTVNSSRLIPHDFGSGVPRKVAYSNGAIVCLADEGLFYTKICSESWNDAYCKTMKLKYKCTDLSASSCDKYFAITTACGRLIIYNGEDENPQEFDIGKGRRCETVKWSDYSLLAQIAGGELNLFEKNKDTFVLTSSFKLTKTRERSLTCFLRYTSFLLVGDRTGNLHIYSELETPVQTIYKLHGTQGISDILKKIDTVLTIGAGGKIKELGFVKGTLCLLRSFSIPMEIASKIINTTTGIVIAGFQGSNFQLWDFEHRVVLGNLKCGGGHRSFDFQLANNNLLFVYIKNKQIFQASFPIRFSKVIRNSYHSKVINCLSAITGFQYPILVSGGEDNSVRIVDMYEHDIKPIAIIEQHISSIRALRVLELPEKEYLIVSAGGREQITFTKYNSQNHCCQELLSYLPKSTLADCRFMCLEVLKLANEKLLIFLGSSDCSIKIFQFDGSLEELAVLKYTHCLLQILIVEKFLVTFSTDGNAAFWDLRQFLDSDGSLPSSPIAKFSLHQSGINSVAIRKRTCNQYLLATGGDDSLLKLSLFELSEEESVPWRLISKWDNSESHACQITGLVFHENLLISTALDYRLNVHQVLEKTSDCLETRVLGETMTTVPDAHGLSLISNTNSSITLCVFGKGIEIVVVEMSESHETLNNEGNKLVYIIS